MPKYKTGLEDHRAIKVVKGMPKLVETRKKGSDGKQRHGDRAIACALAWFASLNDCENVMVAEGSVYSNIWSF